MLEKINFNKKISWIIKTTEVVHESIFLRLAQAPCLSKFNASQPWLNSRITWGTLTFQYPGCTLNHLIQSLGVKTSYQCFLKLPWQSQCALSSRCASLYLSVVHIGFTTRALFLACSLSPSSLFNLTKFCRFSLAVLV